MDRRAFLGAMAAGATATALKATAATTERPLGETGVPLQGSEPLPARACGSWPSSRGVDALKEWVLLAEVELEHGKIRLLAFEIAPYSSDRLGHLWRGRAGFCAGHLAQQHSLGRCGALRRQLEARDARAVPGDPAKAARSFENEIMVCPAHHMALAFRSAMELVGPRWEFNRVLAL